MMSNSHNLTASAIGNLVLPVLLNSYPDLQGLYLFGSFADQSHNEQSDVDLALLLPHHSSLNAQGLRWGALPTELATLTRREVDLINLRQVSCVFQNEIIEHGSRIYCADEGACDEFEGLALSLLQKLNEERADILQEIMRTGRVTAAVSNP